jgi:hypothetical protein
MSASTPSNPPTERKQAEAMDAQHDGAQDMERGPVCRNCGRRMSHNSSVTFGHDYWFCAWCGAREEGRTA